MDPEQRAIAVKERMTELKAQHLPLARPCSACRFGPIELAQLGVCEHYANWEITADPITGRRKGRANVSTVDARSADGLCGPEGMLFERRSIGQKIALFYARGSGFELWMTVLLGSGALLFIVGKILGRW